MLPYPEAGKNDKETLNNLFDAYFKLRKELEWLLHNLDDNNILEIDAAKIKNLEAVLIVSDTVITNILYAQEGRIARLTVDHLLTEDLLVGAEIMDYIDIEDNYIKFIHATRLDELPQIQYTDTSEAPLYWDSEAHNHMTTEDTGIPVMVYQYERQEKMKIWFNPDDPNHVPVIEMGIGSGYGDDYGKGFIYKGVDGLYIEYRHSVTGNPRIFKLTDDGLDLSQFENVDFNENVYLMHRGRNLVQESDYSNAEGDGSKATGPASHAEGVNTKASGSASHAEGRWTHAAESNSHAEGAYAQALSSDSHAGGSYTMAGPFEFVDGAVLQSAMLASPAPVLNYANPSFSVSDASVFSGMSHILMVTNGFYEKWEIGSIVGSRIYLEGDPFREGTFGTAVGAPIYPITDEIDADASFVHGYDNKVCGYAAACFGVKNIAHREAQFVVGKYNNPLENTLFVVGNGNGTTRSNALSVDDGGNLDISGEYRVNGVPISVGAESALPDAPEAVFIGSATLLTGTITNFTDPTLTGVGTQFLSEVSIGDLLTVAPTPGDDPWSPLKSGFFEVTGVTSDTVLEVTAHGDYEVNNVNLPLLIKVSSTLPAPGGDGSLFDGFASIEEAFATYSFANPEKEYNIHIIAGDINAELPIEYLAAPVGVAVTLYAWVPPASINVRSCTLVKLRITCHHGTHNISIENSANVLLETHEENIQGDISVYDSRNIQIDTFATYLEVSGDSSLSVYGADETDGLKVSHLFNYPAAAENTAAFTDDGDRMVLPGMTFFHTTLGKPVWYSGTDWVDATGTTIQEE